MGNVKVKKSAEIEEEKRLAEEKRLLDEMMPDMDNLLLSAIADLDAQREQDKIEQQLALAELASTILGGNF